MERWAKQKPVVDLMKAVGGWLPEKALADGGYVVLTKKILQQFISYNNSMKDRWRDWLQFKGMDLVPITNKDATVEKLCDFVGDVIKTYKANGLQPSWSVPPENIQLGGASWYPLKPGQTRIMEAAAAGNISGEESSSDDDGDEEDESGKEED